MNRSNALSVLVGLVAFCALGQAPAWADSGWSIRNFDVQLVINPDASLDVTETIDADFSVPKHGILREMPIRYAVGMHQYALRVKLRGVDDGEGRDYETSVSYEENLMKIRIGSPEYTVQGRRRYRLRYQVERAILWEGNHAWEKGNYAVLRWNATGTEWQVPIDAAKVTVHLPRDLNDFELGYDAWTGYFNARGKNFTKRAIDARTVEFTTGPLQPRKGSRSRSRCRRTLSRSPAGGKKSPGGWPITFPTQSSPRPWPVAFSSGSFAAATCRAPARSWSTTRRRTA